MKLESPVRTLVWGTERWVASARPELPSVVADGPAKGRALSEVAGGFPLLVKVIDAKTRLSVQVHPNARTAPLTGGEPKTEAWCILESGPIYAGLKQGAGRDDVEAAVRSGRFEELLVRHDAKKGEIYFIPGGLVHAIGDGVKIFEVQQSSDTTFRLYDWGRTGADGKPRDLHIEKSLAAIDYSLPPPEPAESVECPYFRMWQMDAAAGAVVAAPADSPLVVHNTETGDTWFLAPGESMTVAVPGRLVLAA